jgi:AbrB family looped-hinge helix DNA binding protein
MNETILSRNGFTNTTMLDVAKMSEKGQIVIPEDMRKKLSLKKGSKLVLRQVGRKVILVSEKDFEAQLTLDAQERQGWLLLAEKSLQKDWSDETDDEWGQYL